jgi:hypothetical protein
MIPGHVVHTCPDILKLVVAFKSHWNVTIIVKGFEKQLKTVSNLSQELLHYFTLEAVAFVTIEYTANQYRRMLYYVRKKHECFYGRLFAEMGCRVK